jgi:hypothetical protein
LGDVPHPHFAVQVVVVAAADLRAIDVSGLDEVGDDSLRRSLSNPDGRGDVPDSRCSGLDMTLLSCIVWPA